MRKRHSETVSDQAPRDTLQNALLAGDMEGCVRAARTVLVQKPNDTEAHQLLGMALMRLGRVEEAIEHAEKRARAAPKDARSRLNLASAMLAAGDNASALQYIHEAIDSDPDEPMFHLILGTALRKLGELAGAIDALNEAIRLDAAREKSKGWYVRLLARRRHWPRGLPAANMNLALAYEEVGRIEEAVAEWQRVSQMDSWSGRLGPNGTVDIISYARRQIDRLTGGDSGCPADPAEAPVETIPGSG